MATSNEQLNVKINVDSTGAPQVANDIAKIGTNISNMGKMADMAAKFIGAAGLGAGLISLAKFTISASSEFETLDRRLKFATGSAKDAAAAFKAVRDVEAKTPFELGELTNAAVLMEQFGISSKKMIPIVADMAAAMGRDVTETAMTMNKALIGSAEGLQMLRDNFGITRQQLEKFGAEFDKSGAITNVAKLDEALLKLAENKYGGAAEEQSTTFAGAMSTLNGAIKSFLADQGAPFTQWLTKVTQDLSSFVGVLSSREFQDNFGPGSLFGGGAYKKAALANANRPISQAEVALASIRAGADPGKYSTLLNFALLEGTITQEQIDAAMGKTGSDRLFKGATPESQAQINARNAARAAQAKSAAAGLEGLQRGGLKTMLPQMTGLQSVYAAGGVGAFPGGDTTSLDVIEQLRVQNMINQRNADVAAANAAYGAGNVITRTGIGAYKGAEEVGSFEESIVGAQYEMQENWDKQIGQLTSMVGIAGNLAATIKDAASGSGDMTKAFFGVIQGIMSIIPVTAPFAPLVGQVGNLVSTLTAQDVVPAGKAGASITVEKAYGMKDLQGQIRSAQTMSNRRNLAWSGA